MPIRTNTRKMTALAACVLVGTLAACTGGEDPSPSPTSTLSAAPSGGSTAPSSSAAGGDSKQSLEHCEVPEGDASIPKEAPAVDEWADVAGVGVPTSKTYGPLVKEGELWQCYEHSPTGALFAAAYLNVAAEGVPGVWDYWLSPEDRQLIAGQSSPDPSALRGVRIVGYQFESATDEKVIVNIALQVPGENGEPAIAGIKTAMVWEDGRWQREVSESSVGAVALTPDLPGYIPWSING